MNTLKIRLIFVCCLLFFLKANAYNFEIDGIYYNKLIDSTVSVTYKDADYNSYSGSVVIPNEVIYEGKSYIVTEIGRNAFYNCKRLRSLTIPNSVITIKNDAIGLCPVLTELYIEDGKDVLSLGYSLGNSSLFASFSNLEYLYLGRNIDNMHKSISPFGGLEYLSTVEIGDSVTDMSDISCFSKCIGLTSVKIGKNVESIGEGEFEGCTSLKSIVIPDNVKVIESSAFDGCANLSSITIGESVERINSPFGGCVNLTSLTVPKSVTHLFFGMGANPYIKTITLLGKVPPVIGSNYSSRTLLKMQIKVPKGYLEVYQAAEGWKEFFEFEEVDFIYSAKYIVEGEIYRTDSISYGGQITTPKYPEKEGHTFSGWSEIPETMPAQDITVTGSFSVNTYKLTYTVDGMVYISSYVTYGDAIFPMTSPTKEGYTFSGWSEVPKTMPAHDVVITGSFEANGIEEVMTDTRVDVYNLQGIKVKEQVLSEELEKILPQGVYVVNGRKMVVK